MRLRCYENTMKQCVSQYGQNIEKPFIWSFSRLIVLVALLLVLVHVLGDLAVHEVCECFWTRVLNVHEVREHFWTRVV